MADDETTEETWDEEPAEKSAPEDRHEVGPLDESEAPVRPYIDLGALRIVPRPGLQMRLEVDQTSKRVVAVTLEHEGSTVQLQPFAAPRSEGIWASVRSVLTTQLERQGATVTEAEGQLGPELRGALPPAQDGAARDVRVVGVDGPRWMLQGLIAGPAATDESALTALLDIYRATVVVRGDLPMPPRELIPLHPPKSA